ALVDRERDPGGAAAASEADGAIVRNAAPLGASLGAARLQRRGLAASSVTGRPTSASDPTLRPTLSHAREGGSPSHSPFVDFFPLEALRPTAARMSALNAFASISSPSRMSMARLTFPSRLELKSLAGSFRAAPLKKVSFTIDLYDSPVQMPP